MPLSPGYYERAVKALTAARPITHRKMFGGAGYYLDGVFFGIADDDKIFFKVDAQTAGDYEAAGMGPWIVGGQINDGYREVPASVLDDPDSLGDSIDAAAEVAKRKASAKKRK